MCRTEAGRGLQTQVVDIDDDDRGGAGKHRTADGVEANATQRR